jgi:hypothetical protein
MAEAKFDEDPAEVYAQLEKAGSNDLLDAIDDAVDILEADPGSAEARRRSFTNTTWGMPIRTRTDDWLLVWEPDDDDETLVHVRFIGVDPFA